MFFRFLERLNFLPPFYFSFFMLSFPDYFSKFVENSTIQLVYLARFLPNVS